jgi:hypothetical protein
MKIQPQWVVTPGKQTNKQQRMILVLETRWDDMVETCSTHEANTFETDAKSRGLDNN